MFRHSVALWMHIDRSPAMSALGQENSSEATQAAFFLPSNHSLESSFVHSKPKSFSLLRRTKRNRCKSKSRVARLGVAAVEFATVAPLLILMIFLMIEASRYLMALHATTGAARSAARATAIAGVSESDATQIARNYMQASSFAPDTVTLDISNDPTTVENMTQVLCTVTIDFDAVSVIGNPFSIGATSVTGRSAMLAPN